MGDNIRHYDSVFKENAVLLSYETKTVVEAAQELGISPKILSKWRSTYKKYEKGSFPGKGYKRIYYINQKAHALELKLSESKLNLEILTQGQKHMLNGKQDLYNFIQANKKKFPIYKMFKVLEAPHSTYYLWKKEPFSKTETRVYLLKKEIHSIFLEYERLYGSIRITKELHRRGFRISDTQVAFYMKQLGLRSRVKKKFKVTTNSKHNFFISPNILNQQFKVSAPSKVWVSDITYLQTDKRFMYLTIIMDLYDRKIIGWSLSNGMSTIETTLAAWKMAVENRKISNGLIFHSDRGSQYANRLFTDKLDSYNCITRSMSGKGNHNDNAVSESFFSSLKRESMYRSRLLNSKQMKAEILDFIEKWYNKKRRHSALDNKTIEEFNAANSA